MEKSNLSNQEKAAHNQLRQNSIPGSDKTIAEHVLEKRNELASEIRLIRQNRDKAREESERALAKVRSALGLKNGSTELSKEASAHHSKARSELSRKKFWLEQNERDLRDEVVESTVYKFLNELANADSPEKAHRAYANISIPNLLASLNDQHQSPDTKAVLDRSVRYASRESRENMGKILAELVRQKLAQQDPDELFSTLSTFGIRLDEQLLASLEQSEQMKLVQILEVRPEKLHEVFEGSRSFTNLCFTYGSEKTRSAFRSLLNQKALNVREYGVFIAPYLNTSEEEEPDTLVREHFSSYLKNRFLLELSEIESSWTFGQGERDVLSNLIAMESLETRVPGSVRNLLDEYGIHEFGRYPPELLISQLQEKEVQQPYGVIVFPKSDWNGAFDLNRRVLEKLYADTRGHYGLKVFEADSTRELARHLNALDKRYGHTNKIRFAIFGGHGSKDSITIGDYYSKARKGWKFFSTDTEKGSVKRAQKYFETNPEIILFSCSTGAEGGIGQKLSASLEAKVTAPAKDASVAGIEVTYDESGNPIFDVEYSVEKNVYTAGVKDS